MPTATAEEPTTSPGAVVGTIAYMSPEQARDFGGWKGLAPDDSPLLLRDAGTQEIYALDVDFP